MIRSPSKTSFFGLLSSNGITVDIVCDVGVHKYGTPDLMKAFPHAFHILVEPVKEFSKSIEVLYSKIPHHLYQIGLGNEHGRLRLKLKRLGGHSVSHSQLVDAAGGGMGLGSNSDTYEVDVKTLAWLIDQHPKIRDATCLLKIDVDGNELQILQGAGSALQVFDLIIIEMPVRFYWPRLEFLISHGFQLVDIVDPTYFHGHLSQVDMVFASTKFLDDNPSFLPWGFYEFDWKDYHHWTEKEGG